MQKNRNEVGRMPDSLKQLIDNAPPWLISALFAVFVAIVRVVYDGKETRPTRMVLEGLLCGLLTVIAHSVVVAMGASPDWSIAAGGTIGFMGSMTVRTLALKLLQNRAK